MTHYRPPITKNCSMNNASVVSTHPAVHAILSGQAPRPASLAAARGMLPLPQADLLEILVGLSRQDDEELSEAAHNTLLAQSHDALAQVAQQPDSAPSVLDYLASRDDLSLPVYESLAQNPATPAVANNLCWLMVIKSNNAPCVVCCAKKVMATAGVAGFCARDS